MWLTAQTWLRDCCDVGLTGLAAVDDTADVVETLRDLPVMAPNDGAGLTGEAGIDRPTNVWVRPGEVSLFGWLSASCLRRSASSIRRTLRCWRSSSWLCVDRWEEWTSTWETPLQIEDQCTQYTHSYSRGQDVNVAGHHSQVMKRPCSVIVMKRLCSVIVMKRLCSVIVMKRLCSVIVMKRLCSVMVMKRLCSVIVMKRPCSVIVMKRPCSVIVMKRLCSVIVMKRLCSVIVMKRLCSVIVMKRLCSVIVMKRLCSVIVMKRLCSVIVMKRLCSVIVMKRLCSVIVMKRPCSVIVMKRPCSVIVMCIVNIHTTSYMKRFASMTV